MCVAAALLSLPCLAVMPRCFARWGTCKRPPLTPDCGPRRSERRSPNAVALPPWRDCPRCC
eukprot:4582698-Pyramimonas_sp.AAC.1